MGWGEKARLFGTVFYFHEESIQRIIIAQDAVPVILKETESLFPVQRIVVFGSVARNEANVTSDVDLAVTTPSLLDDESECRIHVRICMSLTDAGFNRNYRNTIQVVLMPDDYLTTSPPGPESVNYELVQNIRKDGLVLYRCPGLTSGRPRGASG